MGWWSDLWKRRSEDWIFSPLDAQQVPGNVEHKPVEENTSYLSIFLKSIRIVNVRKGLAKFYGTVHSFISLPHISGDFAEFNVVTTPSSLINVDAERIDRIIQINKRLLGPIPYRGGDMEMEIGLFSIKSADLSEPFVSLLEKMSDLAGVSYISDALKFAEPIIYGVNLLTGSASDTILEIGVSATFSRPQTGYYLVMRAPKQDIDVEELEVDPKDFRLVSKNNQPIDDYPYMIFEISASPRRNEWFLIPEIRESYNALQEDIRKGDNENIAETLVIFKRIALTCGDLLPKHALSLVNHVDADVQSIMSATKKAIPEAFSTTLRDLNQIHIDK